MEGLGGLVDLALLGEVLLQLLLELGELALDLRAPLLGLRVLPSQPREVHLVRRLPPPARGESRGLVLMGPLQRVLRLLDGDLLLRLELILVLREGLRRLGLVMTQDLRPLLRVLLLLLHEVLEVLQRGLELLGRQLALAGGRLLAPHVALDLLPHLVSLGLVHLVRGLDLGSVHLLLEVLLLIDGLRDVLVQLMPPRGVDLRPLLKLRPVFLQIGVRLLEPGGAVAQGLQVLLVGPAAGASGEVRRLLLHQLLLLLLDLPVALRLLHQPVVPEGVLPVLAHLALLQLLLQVLLGLLRALQLALPVLEGLLLLLGRGLRLGEQRLLVRDVVAQLRDDARHAGSLRGPSGDHHAALNGDVAAG
mmetsp:Transcript_46414/g.101334  ORF Transcript_46414/g.101334 Transcript_46414/m.101334 type:complete len:362 (-) Transcript_46414:147-1232(-)